MLTTQQNDFPTAAHAAIVNSSRFQRQGKLWSNLKEVCDLLHIPVRDGGDDLRFQHVQFKAGQRVHTIGQPFDALYIVNSGFLKSVMIDDFGNEQVLAFPVKGDLFGIDGIHRKQYETETIALTNCDVVLVPFKALVTVGKNHPELEAAIYGVMSRELVREQAMVGALGSLCAEARVARFLVMQSERFTEMGYSGSQFNLRMSRQDIGSYLGLTLETVSRTFSAFNTLGLISVDQRAIVLHDVQALRTLRRLPPAKLRAKAEGRKTAKAVENTLALAA